MADPVIKSPVTASVKQPPGGQVTEVHKKEPEANVINQAEAKQQAEKQSKTTQAVKGVGDVEVDPNYSYEVEQGIHKLTVSPQIGLTYNYFVLCSGCAWEGRYLTSADAESACQQHLALKYPSRG